MLLSQTFLSFLFIALSAVDASPLIRRDGGKQTLFILRTIILDMQDGATIVEKDRAHAHEIIRGSGRTKSSDTSVNITNAIGGYIAQVGIGEPAYNYTLLVDTGSSNTWVGANPADPYIHTKTSIDTGNYFSISYGSGKVAGKQFFDTVALAPGLVIKNQSIGAATSSTGFQGVDGILGLGPVDLTSKTVNNTSTVPTVVDNLYSQRVIREEVLGVYFVPSAEMVSTGELTFGGYDSSVIASPIQYLPITGTSPASKYWGANQTIYYGNEIIQLNAAGVVDTGSTLILLETSAFRKYQNATGAVLDESTGLLAISAAQYARLKPLSFNIGGVCAELTPNAQIWPRSLNTVIGGHQSAIYLVVADLNINGLSTIGFIDGYTFLERFYSVFDTTNKRIGFAKTAYTDSEIN